MVVSFGYMILPNVHMHSLVRMNAFGTRRFEKQLHVLIFQYSRDQYKRDKILALARNLFILWVVNYTFAHELFLHLQLDRDLSMMAICDWILENRPNCHNRPIPFYWPN